MQKGKYFRGIKVLSIISITFLLLTFFSIPIDKVEAQTLLNINKTLKYGTVGTEVQELQKFLNDSGFTVSTTGAGSPGNETTFFGSATQKAVESFQKANKLQSDGIVGRNTRSVLTSGLSGGGFFR